MNFWDSSAIVALLVGQPGSDAVTDLRRRDAMMVVWWGTWVECASAIARLVREKAIGAEDAARAGTDLSALSTVWGEVEPTTAVRERAMALVSRHPLKAADALQLGAASVALSSAGADGPTFVCLDRPLCAAARAEGLSVYPAEGDIR